MRTRALALLVLAACSGAPPTPASSPVGKTSALPQLLTVAACPQVDGRVLTLSTASDGILDAFAYVKHCHAEPDGRGVALSGDAWVWVAVDRDLGAVRLRQFVHASLQAQVGLGVAARYEDEHLVLTLSPHDARAAVEPVGALEVSPLNWASLLAIELAPAAGTSVELVAKRRLQKETETAIAGALTKPLVFAYDARKGETVDPPGSRAPHVANGPAERIGPRVRVVPRGTALLGPYPEGSAAPDVRLGLGPNAVVAARAVCRSHAERLLEADRRGDPVGLEDWTKVTGTGSVPLAPPPCPWLLALRAMDDAGAVVDVEVHAPVGDANAHERNHRWISLDELTTGSGQVPLDEQLVVSTDVERRFLASKVGLPALFELSGDESLWLRSVRPGKDPANPTVTAKVALPLDEHGDVDTTVELPFARLHLRARVREAP